MICSAEAYASYQDPHRCCLGMGLFSTTEPFERRQFSLLHLIVLGLTKVPRDLRLELQQETSDINVTDAYGRTALSWAADRKDLDALNALLDFGANPEIADKSGCTAVHHAAYVHSPQRLEESTTCLNSLILYGADSNRKDRFDHTPLHWARPRQSVEMLIRHGAKVDAKDSWERTPIFYACRMHDEERALALIESGAAINARDSYGSTPIMQAIFVCANDVVGLLLSHGASYRVRNYINQTVLHMIAQAPSSEIGLIRTLTVLDWKGVDVNARDTYGDTARDNLMDRNKSFSSELLIAYETLFGKVEADNGEEPRLSDITESEDEDSPVFMDAFDEPASHSLQA